MNPENSPQTRSACTGEEVALDFGDQLSARASTYAVLGWAFSFPMPRVARWLKSCDADAPSGEEPVSTALSSLLRAFGKRDSVQLREAYLKVFDPVSGPFPYEAEYRQLHHEFSKAHVLADIMGFYRAFGVAPDSERPDHIAAELEFMHYVLLKEKSARSSAEPDHAQVCTEGSEAFFRDHLGAWTEALIEDLNEKVQDLDAGPYERLPRLLEAFAAAERRHYGPATIEQTALPKRHWR